MQISHLLVCFPSAWCDSHAFRSVFLTRGSEVQMREHFEIRIRRQIPFRWDNTAFDFDSVFAFQRGL